MTQKWWFWLLVDLILIMLLVDGIIILSHKLPDTKPTNGWTLWDN